MKGQSGIHSNTLSWRHSLSSYPAVEGAFHIHHNDTSMSKIQASLPSLQPVQDDSGCGCGHNEEFPFLIKLTQKCNCCSDTHPPWCSRLLQLLPFLLPPKPAGPLNLSFLWPLFPSSFLSGSSSSSFNIIVSMVVCLISSSLDTLPTQVLHFTVPSLQWKYCLNRFLNYLFQLIVLQHKNVRFM